MEVLLGIAAGMIIGNVIGHWQAWPEIRKLRQPRTPARYFASGPNGYFYAGDIDFAESLLATSGYERDDWTITDLTAQPAVPCCECDKPVDTRENGTPGAELTDGRWVCSEACWERATSAAPQPEVDSA